MQIRSDALSGHLASRRKAGTLLPLYVVASDEPLLAMEALAAIRSTARALDFSEREVLHADARFDWSLLGGAAGGLSLFAQRRILELRLPSGKPGKSGAEALRAFASASDGANADLVTLFALPKLDRNTRQSSWALALDNAGAWIDIDRVERAALPEWIGTRLQRQQQTAPRNALDFIADRVEGNLLAAHQEILKLGLLYPTGELSLEQITHAVLDVARFDVFSLPPALLAGDAARALRLLDGLRAEGAALPLLVWAVGEELRTWLRMKEAVDRGMPYAAAAREHRVWGLREKLMPQALKRVSAVTLGALLARLADVDRITKGLRAPQRGADPWLELADIALACSARSPR